MIGRSTLVVSYCLVAWEATDAREFTPTERSTIDARALAVSEETTRELAREAGRGLALWLIDRIPDSRGDSRAFDETLKPVERIRRIVERLAGGTPGMRPLADDVSAGLGRARQDPEHGDEQLAFEIAREIGRRWLGHTSREARVQRVLEAANDGSATATAVRVALRNRPSGTDTSPRVASELDLFALHLCRNAGFDLEACLDAVRDRAVGENTEADHPNLRRLAELRREIDGDLGGETYGLFRFDPTGGGWSRVGDDSVAGRACILVHGMESSPRFWTSLASELRRTSRELTVLAFRYPNDGSLWRAGIALGREIERVAAQPLDVDFVAHSAGGLVVRVHTERLRAPFRSAVLIGTPHGGSALADLRALLEAGQFLGDLRFGCPAALRRCILDGRGQISCDLRPGSPLVRYLQSSRDVEGIRARYVVVRGRRLDTAEGIAARGAFVVAKRALGRRVRELDAPEELEKLLLDATREVPLPAEFTNGDMAVSLVSATLPGARRTLTVEADHLSMVEHADVVEAIHETLSTAWDRPRQRR